MTDKVRWKASMARRLGRLALPMLLAAASLTGCFLDDSSESCGASAHALSATADGCVDSSPAECVGDLPRRQASVLRVRSEGVSGDADLVDVEEVRVQSTEVQRDRGQVTLLIRRAGGGDPRAQSLTLGQSLDLGGDTYRLAQVCDTDVAYLVRVE